MRKETSKVVELTGCSYLRTGDTLTTERSGTPMICTVLQKTSRDSYFIREEPMTGFRLLRYRIGRLLERWFYL